MERYHCVLKVSRLTSEDRDRQVMRIQILHVWRDIYVEQSKGNILQSLHLQTYTMRSMSENNFEARFCASMQPFSDSPPLELGKR